jgi:hypothetical protein
VHRQDERLPIDRLEDPDVARASLERLGLGYLVENTDSDDLDYVLSVLEAQPRRTIVRRIVSAATRRLGGSAKK